jgi:hypothetical protein
MSTFYSRVPKRITAIAAALEELLMTGEYDTENIITTYFGEYWLEFSQWWEKNHGEHIDWVTFGLAPHNATWFTTWVFVKYPDVYEKVKQDLQEVGVLK